MTEWIRACARDDVEIEDVIRFDHGTPINGRFNYKTGQGKGAPIIAAIRTYPTRVEGDTVVIGV